MKIGYICDYCNEIMMDRDKMEQHERICNYNPKNRACFTCNHCITDYYAKIKCTRRPDRVSVSLLGADLITKDCEFYEEGTPMRIFVLDEES